MRDPELVVRAQRAAAHLESAWERWRALQGLGETPAQPVVGYVGYALSEPWGQPRAVIGFSAEEAERLAEFLERGNTEHALELAQRHVPDRPPAQLLAAVSAVKTDVLAVTSQLAGLQRCHSFSTGKSARLKTQGPDTGRCADRLDSGRPGPGPSPDFSVLAFPAVSAALYPTAALGYCCGAARCFADDGVAATTGGTSAVQYMHRVAAIGMVLRHSGQSLVVASCTRANRVVILAIGATRT